MTELSPEEQATVDRFGIFDAERVDELIPWPKQLHEATADRMIAFYSHQSGVEHELALAYMRFSDRVEVKSEEWRRRNLLFAWWSGAFISSASIAVLLVGVQREHPALADRLAGLVWDMTEDGGDLGESTWAYLDERGFYADLVFRAAEDLARSVLRVVEPEAVGHVGWNR